MTRDKVYKAIDTERHYQDRKWGTVEENPHDVGAWLTIMRNLLTDAEVAFCTQSGDMAALIEMRKVIAVGVACFEQHGIGHRYFN